jgi:hypothetical protein
MRNIDASETLSTPELKVIQTGSNAGPGAQFTLFASQRSAAADDEASAKRTARAAGAGK